MTGEPGLSAPQGTSMNKVTAMDDGEPSWMLVGFHSVSGIIGTCFTSSVTRLHVCVIEN